VTPDQTATAASFAAVAVSFYAAHHVGDQWVQTHHQAMHKGLPGWRGRLPCLRHVYTYTLTTLAFVTGVTTLLGLTVTPWGLLAGQALSAVTHYWADRRSTLGRLADTIGKGEYYRLGSPREGHDDNPSIGTGAYALDQSWHIAWLAVAALITVLI
jgi:hypothetical protein